jgi:hypothetical protein
VLDTPATPFTFWATPSIFAVYLPLVCLSTKAAAWSRYFPALSGFFLA